MNVAKKKPSEWLWEIDSHSIVSSKEAKLDFEKQTGLAAPSWPEYSARATQAHIAARGLGGSCRASEKPMAYGWLMAEATAAKYAPQAGAPWAMYEGRGRRFREAVAALHEAGL